MDAATLDEAAAVLQAVRGDVSAFGSLVKAYQRQAYAIAYGFVGNREDALELAQDSFARAYRAMPRFDTGLPFYPWFYRIVKNTCLNHIKKKRRHGELSLDGLMDAGYDVADDDADSERDAELGDLRRAIGSALKRLPPEHREILILRHFQDLSYAEIAACLGVPQGTVMSRLHAARKNLRAVLENGAYSSQACKEACP
jgi:RNA polymerase sigma-70 factor, ECF subfamily